MGCNYFFTWQKKIENRKFPAGAFTHEMELNGVKYSKICEKKEKI